MLFPEHATQAANELLGIPPRQFTALALRFEDSIPRPYHDIAKRMGTSRQNAYKLVKKGSARLRIFKIDVNTLMANRSLARVA